MRGAGGGSSSLASFRDLLCFMCESRIHLLVLTETGIPSIPDAASSSHPGNIWNWELSKWSGENRLPRYRIFWCCEDRKDQIFPIAGHGVAILYDCRFHLVNSEINFQGHLCRVMFHHPFGFDVSVVAVYQYSTSTKNKDNRSAVANAVLQWTLPSSPYFWNNCKLLVMGDLNSVVDASVDRLSGISHNYDVNGLASMLGSFLVDTFRISRVMSPVSALWSWSKAASASRIDYIFVTDNLIKDVTSCEILQGPRNHLSAVGSDHLPVVVEFIAKNWCGGKRLAPFPTTFRLREFVDYAALDVPFLLKRFQSLMSDSVFDIQMSSLLTIADLLEPFSPIDVRRCWADEIWSLFSSYTLASLSALRKKPCHRNKLNTRFFIRQKLRKLLGHLRGCKKKLLLADHRSLVMASSWTSLFNRHVNRYRFGDSFSISILPNEWSFWESCHPLEFSPALFSSFVEMFFVAVNSNFEGILKWIQSDVQQRILRSTASRDAKFERLFHGKKGDGCIHRLTGKAGSKVVLDQAELRLPDGSVRTVFDPDGVKEGVRQYFYDWTRSKASPPPEVISCSSDDGCPLYSVPDFSSSSLPFLSLYAHNTSHANLFSDVLSDISYVEFESLLGNSPLGRAPGPSGITNEVLRALPNSSKELFRRMLNSFLRLIVIPLQFKKGLILPIPKGHSSAVKDSRPISLLEHSYKLLSAILCRRLTFILESNHMLHSSQYGFRKGVSCLPLAWSVHSLLESLRDSNDSAHLLFVDLTRAFDSVERWSLDMSYGAIGFPDVLRRFLWEVDIGANAKVITPFGLTASYFVECGVPQGDVLSPLKFLIWINFWLRYRDSILVAPLALTDSIEIRNFAYADDLLEVTSSATDMQLIAMQLSSFLTWHGVNMNEKKTVYISTNPLGHCHALEILKWDGGSRSLQFSSIDRQEKATPVKYLGFWLTLTGDFSFHEKSVFSKVVSLLRILRVRNLTGTQCQYVVNSVIGGLCRYYLSIPGLVSSNTLSKLNLYIRRLVCNKFHITSVISKGAFYSDNLIGGFGGLDLAEIALESSSALLQYAFVDQGKCLTTRIILHRLRCLSTANNSLSAPFRRDLVSRFSVIPFLVQLRILDIRIIAFDEAESFASAPLELDAAFPDDLVNSDPYTEICRLLFLPLSPLFHMVPDQNLVSWFSRMHPVFPVDLPEIFLFTDGSVAMEVDGVKASFSMVSLSPIGSRLVDILGYYPALVAVENHSLFSGWYAIGGSIDSCGTTVASISLCELFPVFIAFLLCPAHISLTIYSDSLYVVNSFNSFSSLLTSQRCKLSHCWLWERLKAILDLRSVFGATSRVLKVKAHLPFDDVSQSAFLTLGNFVADSVVKSCRNSVFRFSAKFVTGTSLFSFCWTDLSITSNIRCFIRKKCFDSWSKLWTSNKTMGVLHKAYVEGLISHIAHDGIWSGSFLDKFRGLSENSRFASSRRFFLMKLQMGVLPSWTRILYNENGDGPLSRACTVGGVVEDACRLCYSEFSHYRGTNDHVMRCCSALSDHRSVALYGLGLLFHGFRAWYSTFVKQRHMIFFSSDCWGFNTFSLKKCRSSSLLEFPFGVRIHISWLPYLVSLNGWHLQLDDQSRLIFDYHACCVSSSIIVFICNLEVGAIPFSIIRLLYESKLFSSCLSSNDLFCTIFGAELWNSNILEPVLCDLQVISFAVFRRRLADPVLNHRSLVAFVSLGKCPLTVLKQLQEMSVTILVHFPANRIPIISRTSFVSSILNHGFLGAFNDPVVLVISIVSEFVENSLLRLEVFWSSLIDVLNESVFGGMWNIDFPSCFRFGLSLNNILHHHADLALGLYETYYMEHEGLNFHHDVLFWKASLPNWFNDFIESLGVPVSQHRLCSSISLFVWSLELEKIWHSFVIQFHDWLQKHDEHVL